MKQSTDLEFAAPIIGYEDVPDPLQESKARNGCFGPRSPDHCGDSAPVSPVGRRSGFPCNKRTPPDLGGVLSETELYEHRWPQSFSATAVEKLDSLILKQAETMGWRMGLSPLVHCRFSEWDLQSNGPALFGLYGKAIAKSARRSQKKEPPALDDPDLYPAKQETVSELRLFSKGLGHAFSKRKARLSSDELIQYFQKTVSAEGDAFIHLKANMNSWLQFFRADPRSIKALLLRKRRSPAALFDSWLAWGKGVESETVRQKISALGRVVRESGKS